MNNGKKTGVVSRACFNQKQSPDREEGGRYGSVGFVLSRPDETLEMLEGMWEGKRTGEACRVTYIFIKESMSVLKTSSQERSLNLDSNPRDDVNKSLLYCLRKLANIQGST